MLTWRLCSLQAHRGGRSLQLSARRQASPFLTRRCAPGSELSSASHDLGADGRVSTAVSVVHNTTQKRPVNGLQADEAPRKDYRMINTLRLIANMIEQGNPCDVVHVHDTGFVLIICTNEISAARWRETLDAHPTLHDADVRLLQPIGAR